MAQEIQLHIPPDMYATEKRTRREQTHRVIAPAIITAVHGIMRRNLWMENIRGYRFALDAYFYD